LQTIKFEFLPTLSCSDAITGDSTKSRKKEKITGESTKKRKKEKKHSDKQFIVITVAV